MIKSGTECIGEGGDILFFMLYSPQHFFLLLYLNYVQVCISS